MLSSPEKTKKKPRLFLKLCLVILVIYLGVAVALHFYRLEKYSYSYTEDKWIELAGTVLYQPVRDLAFNRKTTAYYDWLDINPADIDQTVLPLTLRSVKDQLADYNRQVGSPNFQRDLGYVDEAALVRPKDFEEKWSLVYCATDDKVCEKSNILHLGSIKVLVDGNLELWGVSEQGKYLQLELIRYLNAGEELEVLFI